MKSNTRFFSMAALIVAVATLVGCTKENIGNGNGLTFTTTVEMPANGTKALDANGHKTFAVGERIKVTCDGGSSTCTSEPLTSSDISADGKAAKFTFNFESTPTLTSGSTVTYEYPAAHSGLSGQDGTLATLQSTYDYASCSPTVTETGSLPSNIQLQNQYAILKLFIKNSVDNDITESITRLTVTNGTNTVIVNRSHAAGPIYVAMLPVTNGNISFTATDGPNNYVNYVKTVTGKTLDAGHLYPVTVSMDKQINLANLTSDYEAQDGDILTGTLAGDCKISVNTDGATVTLRNATITGTNNNSYPWAGITCENNTTLVIKGTNNVTGFYAYYPGIQIASGKTLTIQGTGTLNASSNGYGAGIGGGYSGGGYSIVCGNIVIESGTINATGGFWEAGIGGGAYANCGSITIKDGNVTATGGSGAAGIGTGLTPVDITGGDISITGGTVVATGGKGAAGIGSGFVTDYNILNKCGDISITGGQVTATGGDGGNVYPDILNHSSWANYTCYGGAGIGTGSTPNNVEGSSSCGTITIESGVTSVTATKGGGTKPATNCIGKNESIMNQGTCGTITIGGTVYWDGISTSPYTYQP